MEKLKVGIIGATGMVGQRLITLLENHPYFTISLLGASSKSKGKKYFDAVKGRWKMKTPIPDIVKEMVIYDGYNDANLICSKVDFIFCTINDKKEKVKELELLYAKLECPVISNNSANRMEKDIPMVIPEINSSHLEVIETQKKRLNTKRGFIVTKSNCSLQSYVPILAALQDLDILDVFVSTYQAISGASKTFDDYLEIIDNCIPYIKNEEEKSELEPLKILGNVKNGLIENNNKIRISTNCIRVPVSDGHLASVFIRVKNKVSKEEVLRKFEEFNKKNNLNLPSSPKKFLIYLNESDRPQPKLDRMNGNGMSISIGRLREDNIFSYKLICLSHNTLRGASKGAILLAELLYEKGYLKKLN